jgi:hypothetical protein
VRILPMKKTKFANERTFQSKFMHLYEVRPRKDHRGADLISDALPFGRLCGTASRMRRTQTHNLNLLDPLDGVAYPNN